MGTLFVTLGLALFMSLSVAAHDLFDADLPPRKLRAAVYIRRSVTDAEGRSKSREEQLHSCRQICERYGLELTDARIYYEAEGHKGDHWWDDGHHPGPHRPELTRMMRDINAGLVDVVVVWRSDRLYRDAGVCDALMKVFREKGIRFFSGPKDLDVQSASGLYHASTEAATNRRWRDTISEDIKRDHQFKAEIGMFSRDPTCHGFRSKGKGTQEVEIVPEELALVNRLFRMFVVGEGDHGPLGLTGIARVLMDEGLKFPKGHKGHKVKNPDKIHTDTLRHILGNCMYVGRWRHNRAEYENGKLLVPVLDQEARPTGKRETAVPLALYDAAQEKLARSDRPGRRSLSSEHLLTGLTVCARCGRPLQVHFTRYKQETGRKTGEPREPRRNFTCNHRRGDDPCPPHSIRRLQEPVLDRWALEEQERLLKEAKERETWQLRRMLDALDAERYIAEVLDLADQEITLLRRQIEAQKKQKQGLMQKLLTGEVPVRGADP